jgi:4-amino-4-deoxychorismate lyase
MCRFIESIQLNNGEFKRLKFHQERMDKAQMDFYPTHKAIDLEKSLSIMNVPVAGIYKCRVVYDSEIRKIEFIPYVRRKIHSLQSVETKMESVPYKKEDRSELDIAFAQRGGSDEVILVRNGLLTDTSFSNIALYDGISWYTPRIPLIQGVTRVELLQQGMLEERDIFLSELMNFQRVSLFNAMNEFGSIELDISFIRQ